MAYDIPRKQCLPILWFSDGQNLYKITGIPESVGREFVQMMQTREFLFCSAGSSSLEHCPPPLGPLEWPRIEGSG